MTLKTSFDIQSSEAHGPEHFSCISELAKELTDVIGDLLRLPLVDEVAHPFHYDYILQIRHACLQTTLVNEFFGTQRVVCEVQVPNYEFCWNVYRSSSPWCKKLPVPTSIPKA